LEYAAHQAMTFRKMNFPYVRECALYFAVQGRKPKLVPPLREKGTYHVHALEEQSGEVS
jgi:hypothetical protein